VIKFTKPGRMKRIYYFLRRQVEWVRLFFKVTIPNSIQRVRKGYGFADTWSFDYYLANVISSGIKTLKDRNFGVPSCIIEAEDWTSPTDEEHNKAVEKWHKILDKIIWTFETSLKIMEMDYRYTPSEEWTEEYYKREIDLIEKVYRDLDCTAHVMTLEECRQYEEGWELFQKYFFNLWD